MNKLYVFFFLILFSSASFAQYYPRGTSMNNGYYPNLDVPDKWIFAVDGMFDWQKESTAATQTSFQTSHANLNAFYGGQNFRGGLQVIHDQNRAVKDLSVGFGLGFNRPLFFEIGAGYLNRNLNGASTEGWSYSAKLGYYYNWIMYVKYRVRVRISLMYNYKKVNSIGDPTVTNFYPLIGFEFET